MQVRTPSGKAFERRKVFGKGKNSDDGYNVLSSNLPLTYENVFRIIIMEFSDRYNLDVRSVKKSCVHIAHIDGRIIPFDTYNIFYR